MSPHRDFRSLVECRDVTKRQRGRAPQLMPVPADAQRLVATGLLTLGLTLLPGTPSQAQPAAPPASVPANSVPAPAPADANAEGGSETESGSRWSRLLERLLFNPRERTVRGLNAVERAQSEVPQTDGPRTGASQPAPAPPASTTPGEPGPDASAASPATATPSGPSIATDAEQAAAAIGPFDSAARLLEQDPLATYNAGTARLLSERADAAPLLESVMESGTDRLASNAAFNLGNSHLETGQLQGAVDAFKQSLRRDPTRTDAKHNLEIAMRRLREQQENQQQNQDQQNQDQQQDQQDQQQDQQNQDQQNQDQQQDQDQQNQDQQDQQDQQQDQDQQNQDQQDQQDQEQQGDQEQQDQEQQPEDGEQEQPQDGDQGEQEERPLPQFEDQPDMTAEEAAAILEAVENLEREARRQEALEAASKQAKGKKDW